MDIVRVQTTKQELDDALLYLKRARESLSKALGTDDPLKYALEATKQGWGGDELIVLDEMIESATKLIATLDTAQSSRDESEKLWKNHIPEDVWEYVSPIANSIDISLMTKSYIESYRESVLHDEGDELSDSIYSYIYEGLTNFAEYGINLTIKDILSTCDLQGYSKLQHIEHGKDDMGDYITLEHWAYHVLTYFLDVMLTYDGYNANMYDVDRVCLESFYTHHAK